MVSPIILEAETPGNLAIARVLAVYDAELARIAPALVEGEDSDALHAYRVALRVSRAVLNARRGVFPLHDLNWIRNGLRWLARETGPARDLDVVLEATSRLALPGALHADAGPLREALCARRVAARQRLRAVLQGSRYIRFTLRYAGFLANRQQRIVCRTRHGNEAIAVLMDGTVRRRYRQVCRAVQQVHAETPLDELHELRKRAKKLRYLLYAFAGLYSDGAREALLKRLKRLQDTLGQTVDLSVQRDYLRRWVEGLGSTAVASNTALALISIQDLLHADMSAARRAIETERAAFLRPKTGRLVSTLMGGARH